jgi:hypothetical protein
MDEALLPESERPVILIGIHPFNWKYSSSIRSYLSANIKFTLKFEKFKGINLPMQIIK